MPYNFNNALYSQGTAGFIDFLWIWYNRISVVIALAILIMAIILAVLTYLSKPQNEAFTIRQHKNK